MIIFFSNKTVYSASFTFPSSLTTNNSDFVLLSETGTTPSVSGFSTDVLIKITATAGFVKIIKTSKMKLQLKQVKHTNSNPIWAPLTFFCYWIIVAIIFNRREQ